MANNSPDVRDQNTPTNPLAAIETKIAAATTSEEAERWVRLRKEYLDQNVERIRTRVLRWVFSIIIAALLLLGLRWVIDTY